MGDRVLFQVVSGKNVSPVVYGHWSGYSAGDVCKRLKERMKGRSGDVEYTAARLVQELIGNEEGNTGWGIWNQTRVLSAGDSHGDAGIVIIDCSGPELSFTCFGGYLKINETTGLPSAGDEDNE